MSHAQILRLPDGDCGPVDVPSVEEWTYSDEEFGRVYAAAYDLDQDGENEVRMSLLSSRGSTFGGIDLRLELDAQEPMELSDLSSFESMVNVTPIPAWLLLPENLCLLRLVEEGLFQEPLAERVDPSLAWLLDANGWMRIEEGGAWIPNDPEMPGHYVVRLELDEGPAWVRYSGHMHTLSTSSRPQWMERAESLPAVIASDEGRVLLATAHGLILTDPERSRHRWLYVYPGGQKLRWPSIEAARFEGEAVILSVPAYSAADPPVEIRIALDSGAVDWPDHDEARLFPPADS